jgi:DNA-binding XRE family transcriptional regulator
MFLSPGIRMAPFYSQTTQHSSRISYVEVNPTRCKELRTARGLSIRKLAEEAGVSTETIYSIEHGKRQPSVRTLGKIAKALDVEVKDFFS